MQRTSAQSIPHPSLAFVSDTLSPFVRYAGRQVKGARVARRYPEHPLVGVGVVVWRDHRVLLVQRRNPPRAGSWSLPGGLLEVGETLVQAAAREVHEETACDIAVGPVVATVDSITYDNAGQVEYHYVLIDLVAEWCSGDAQPNDESSAVAWASLAELPHYQLWSETERIIRLAATQRVAQ